MISVISQMGVLIVAGVVWRYLRPGEIDAPTLRRALTTLVYYLLLPALVLKTLWLAPLGADSLRIALVAGFTVLAALLTALMLCRICRLHPAAIGALLLAAAWPNATYLGLPVLDALFGLEGRAVAIQYDLFACLPLLLLLSVWIGRRYGTPVASTAPANAQPTPSTAASPGVVMETLVGLARVPALWAALVAVALNVTGVALPEWGSNVLGFLSHSVAPLMLFALGLALTFDRFRSRDSRALLLVAVIQLLLAPAYAWALVRATGLTGVAATGSILEAAMPAMVLGLVFCDRYRLDTSLYAAAVTLTTLAAFITLPMWFWILGGA